jgi:putative intracellular protease/amidase
MKSVVLVVSEVGYTWEEVIAPFQEFEKNNLAITIATPTGKLPKPDPLSIKKRSFLSLVGLGINPSLSQQTEIGQRLIKLLEKPIPLKSINEKDYSAIYIAGGHGSLFDLNKNETLHQLILQFFHQKKPVGILCHASSTIAFMKEGSKPFITDKLVTGFPTLWEYGVLSAHQVYQDFLPLPIWTGKELNRYKSKRNLFTKLREVFDMYYVIKDSNLISGVGPKTGGIIAKKMIAII